MMLSRKGGNVEGKGKGEREREREREVRVKKCIRGKSGFDIVKVTGEGRGGGGGGEGGERKTE